MVGLQNFIPVPVTVARVSWCVALSSADAVAPRWSCLAVAAVSPDRFSLRGRTVFLNRSHSDYAEGRGKVRAAKDGRMFGDLNPGDFVGSALILSGIPSNVAAVIVEPLRAMRWQIGILEKYLSANSETLNLMQRISPITSLEKSDVWLRSHPNFLTRIHKIASRALSLDQHTYSE